MATAKRTKVKPPARKTAVQGKNSSAEYSKRIRKAAGEKAVSVRRTKPAGARPKSSNEKLGDIIQKKQKRTGKPKPKITTAKERKSKSDDKKRVEFGKKLQKKNTAGKRAADAKKSKGARGGGGVGLRSGQGSLARNRLRRI